METPTVILIVEDHAMSRELAKEILSAAGYSVLSAEDGVGLLDRVAGERPDLILMDLQLPGIDGLTLVRRLKAHDATRSIPVVMTTAHTQPELYADALEAGCAAYLAKPLAARILLQTVAATLKRRTGDHADA